MAQSPSRDQYGELYDPSASWNLPQKVNFADKDDILVSLYDDLQQGKIQLEGQDPSLHLISIRMYKTLLQTIRKKIMKAHQIAETKEDSYIAEGFDVKNNMEYLSFCHSDITNLRFAMKDLPQDAHNVELRGLKQRSLLLIEEITPNRQPVLVQTSTGSPAPKPRLKLKLVFNAKK